MIVLTTPTGNIGSKILQRLKDRTDLRLRLIARDPAKLGGDLPAHIEVIRGRTDDAKSLRDALDGAHTLFWCQPDTPTAEDYLKAYDDWSRLALEAIEATGVSRVVAISGVGEAPNVPAGPASGLHLIEKNLSRSRAACRFLRSGSFFSNILWEWEGIVNDGVFSYSMPGGVRSPHVATDDIAAVAAGLLTDATWSGTSALQLPGPRDLSYDEMAAELTAFLGRPVRYEAISAAAYRERSVGLGLSASAAQGLVDMFAYLGRHPWTFTDADRSRTPTTFPHWLRAHAPRS